MQYIPVIGGPKPYSSLGVLAWRGDPDPKVPSFATKAEAEAWGQKKVIEMNAKEEQ